MLVCLAFAVFFTASSAGAVKDYQTPRYEVLIHDMNEFDTSKYEIIEQRGKIFVVEEK